MAGLLAIAWSRIRNVTSGRLLGRVSSGTGRAEELTPAQVRSLCSVYSTSEVDAIAAAKLSLSGGTLTGHLLFTDNTYDIGASGATRPRTVHAGTSVLSPLFNNQNAAATTLGNSTYGVTVPGAIASSGGIVVNGATDSANSVTTGNGAGVTIAYLSSAFAHLAFNAKYNGSAYICGQTGYGLSALYANSTGTLQFNALPSATAGGSYGAGTTIASLTRAGLFTVADASVTGTVQVGNATADGTGAKLFVETGIYTPGFLWSTGYARCAALTTTGDISMQKATQGYIRAYNTAGTANINMYHDGFGYVSSSSSYLCLNAGNNIVACYKPSTETKFQVFGSSGNVIELSYAGGIKTTNGVLYISPQGGASYFVDTIGAANSTIYVFNGASTKYTAITHDSTNGILSTSSGNLNLVPTGGTVAVTGAVTVSGALNFPPITKAALLALTPTAATAGRWRVTDATPASREAYPDGTNWRYTSDDTIVV